MKRLCRICKTPAHGPYCPSHQHMAPSDPTSYNRTRSRREQNQFRLAVLQRDRYRCRCRGHQDGCDRDHPDPCGASHDLQAHHVRPGMLVQDGITLCCACHRQWDRMAR